jgi:hypothetical protein
MHVMDSVVYADQLGRFAEIVRETLTSDPDLDHEY